MRSLNKATSKINTGQQHHKHRYLNSPGRVLPSRQTLHSSDIQQTFSKVWFSIYSCILVLHPKQKAVVQRYGGTCCSFLPSLTYSPTTLPALCQREKVRKMSRFVSPLRLSGSSEGTRWPNKPVWKSQHLHKCFSAKHLPWGPTVWK